jgi:cytochrome c oxidase assembly protein subunit 15
MDPQPLYDLSPAIHVMLMGLVVALGPISWVWVRSRQADPMHRLQALTLITLFLTFDLVMFGAFTRLTDSGLGCPDWPGCYGNASPTGAHSQISAAQSAMPTGPVTHTKAWIEMIHRYLATAVGVLIVTLAAVTWVQRRRDPRLDMLWPTVTLAWVCLQGAFGALTVTMKLFPAIVTLHLLGGLVLLALLCRQALVLRSDAAPHAEITPVLRACLIAAFALVWLQAALGGWVSTNYAVLACSEFPTCQGSWWPAMDWRQGFEIWRALGLTAAGAPIDFAALTAIHYAHRLFAYVVLAALVFIAWQFRRGGLQRHARWIAALAAMQLATGLSNVILGWPLIAAVAHTGGAAALVVVLTWALLRSRAGAATHLRSMKAGSLSA